MSVARPKALIFDWDNTLVDTWPVIHAALFETFTAMGQTPWTLAETRLRVRLSMRESFPILFGDRWTAAREIFYEAYERVHLDRLVACEGAGAVLSGLHNAGFYLAVISNKTGRYLRAEALHLGWDGYFGQVIGAGDAPRDKPAPDPVSLALEGSGVAAGGQVWMVGDSGVDMEIAHATGLVPVLLRGGTPAAGEFDAYPPSLHVADCRGLLDMVKDL
ncbi:MAG: Phosphoglycolate phosphatase [Alphaproteobacteria bacterium MarineAlpha10_Bin3]|nr:MAG: Phosphoglycolate phosphatase [Alphaproteobacteria bacterium MarineAlpha10_Bin3]PPR75039.1 MAG: Phosphoglycolate phosphatase [Alphaproteobacteria bacterium MarineAlpha4_Bin1]